MIRLGTLQRVDKTPASNAVSDNATHTFRLILVLFVFLAGTQLEAFADNSGDPFPATNVVDATTLHGKVMCGYQGWFRCPGDKAMEGWIHWSRDSSRIALDTLTFELWPDMTDYPPAERFPAPGFTNADGSQRFFSATSNPARCADIFSGCETTESTALGAAYLAGLATGFWKDQGELAAHLQLGRRFEPSMDVSRREELYGGWERAVERAKGWAK